MNMFIPTTLEMVDVVKQRWRPQDITVQEMYITDGFGDNNMICIYTRHCRGIVNNIIHCKWVKDKDSSQKETELRATLS